MDCLIDIIGITKDTQIPFYADLSTDVQDDIIASSSGLFVDELPGGIDLNAVDDSTYMISVLNSALKARGKAIKTLEDDLLVAINNRFQPSKIKFNGEIGRRAISATSSSSAEIQGQRYKMFHAVAGFITINKISINVSGNKTFNIYIGRCDNGEPAIQEILYIFPVTSTNGLWADADMSDEDDEIKLPMEIDGIPQEYIIYWKRSEADGLFAKNNEIKCSTCSGKTRNDALAHFMWFDGIALNDTDHIRNGNVDKKGHGLSITAIVSCDHNTIICREYEKQEAVARMMQWAALYKTGELWIEYIFKSGYVNQTNLQNREYLWGKRNHFRKEYDERITSIANTMELGETNCYTCKDSIVMKGLIKA